MIFSYVYHILIVILSGNISSQYFSYKFVDIRWPNYSCYLVKYYLRLLATTPSIACITANLMYGLVWDWVSAKARAQGN